jgi:DNA-binding NtrC family response regulator
MAGTSLSHFLSEIAKSSPTARVVLMSGYADEDTLVEARRHGIPVLVKPFTLDQLAAVLATAASHENRA